MNKLFSLVRERARGKMADESANEESVAEGLVAVQGSVVEQSESIIDASAPIEDEQNEEPLYGIVIHNDDKTTFDYVIFILTYYFMLSRELAEHIADVTHKEGSSLALLRPYEEAQYLIKIAHMKAELDGYPLKFSLEAPDEEPE